MYRYPDTPELTVEQLTQLLDDLEKCIDDPHVALHRDEATEVLRNFFLIPTNAD